MVGLGVSQKGGRFSVGFLYGFWAEVCLWNLYNECSLSEDLAGEKCKNFQESTYQLTSTNLLWDRILFFASLWCVMLLARLGEVSLIDTQLRFGCFSFVIFCFVCLLHP